MRRGTVRSERGQIFLITALTLPVLLAMAAIVVDLGNLYYQKRTLRGAADAAALAAAQDLNKPGCAGGSCITRSYGQVRQRECRHAFARPIWTRATPDGSIPAGKPGCFVYPYNTPRPGRGEAGEARSDRLRTNLRGPERRRRSAISGKGYGRRAASVQLRGLQPRQMRRGRQRREPYPADQARRHAGGHRRDLHRFVQRRRRLRHLRYRRQDHLARHLSGRRLGDPRQR